MSEGRIAPGDTSLPELPPREGGPATLLALSGAVVQQYHLDTLTAVVEAIDPDAVVATNPAAGTVRSVLGQTVPKPIVRPGRGMVPDVATACSGDLVVVAAAGGADSFPRDAVDDALEAHTVGEATHRVLITRALSLTVDPYERETTLEGVGEYRRRLPDEWCGDDTTHLSTALRSGFHTRWRATDAQRSMTVAGIGDSAAALGVGVDDTTTTAAVVEVYPNGAISTDELSPEAFGLRSIRGIGRKRATTLRSAGIATPEAIVDVRLDELAAMDGFGRASASSIQAGAKAVVTGTVVPTGDDALPRGDPVFVDIETDGLDPSTAWLVGVLDGDAEDGTYLAFREGHPGDSAHLEGFMTWLTGSAAGRPVVAWNGHGFDFPVIEDQLRQHCPEYVDAWQDTYRFDALWWARDKNGGNAALPGRTNTLESVAEALGWTPRSNGIDGATVAELYVAWRRQVERAETPADVPDPDWDRLERYCEDDVRALATIYEALADAARRDPETTAPTGENSTQGALSDFG